ncbi:MAG: hypothetical protein LBL95_08370, partial [Deltaproteobacteria bacterium]|nr:hypothetical protein [Deltaproteobacteria bacterium]
QERQRQLETSISRGRIVKPGFAPNLGDAAQTPPERPRDGQFRHYRQGRLSAGNQNAFGPPSMIDGPFDESKKDPNDVHVAVLASTRHSSALPGCLMSLRPFFTKNQGRQRQLA